MFYFAVYITHRRGFIPLNGGIYFDGYHVPNFGENILSVHKLSKIFDALFQSDDETDISTCSINLKATQEPVFRTDAEEGLYKLRINHAGDKGAFSSNVDMDLIVENNNGIHCFICANTVLSSTQRTSRPTSILHNNKPLQWHYRTGHPSPARYFRLAKTFEDVPYFTRNTMEDLLCVPCQIGKARRAPVASTQSTIVQPLELVHTDISGPVTPSTSGSIYALCFMDSFTAKSDVFFLKNKSELPKFLTQYKTTSELHTGTPLRKIRLDGAGENMSRIAKDFCIEHGIVLQPSPPHAHQSNGTAERLNHEFWARTRVLLLASKLPDTLWAEAMHHANWLRNRLPASRVQGNIPILLWKPRTKISFGSLPMFGQPGFAFRYRSDTAPDKKFLARSTHGHFVGMASEETLFRIFLPETKSIILTRSQDFRAYEQERLPGVASILDGISRQTGVESLNRDDEEVEDFLVKAFQAFAFPSQTFSQSIGAIDNRLPRTFSQAIVDPAWREAIDREYKALRDRGTWRYVPRTTHMRPVPFTWVFRLKPLDVDGIEMLRKARCCIRGNKQQPHIDFDPQITYAPVASHEAIRLLLAFAAGGENIIEGADISNAYLYGDVDVPIVMEQPTDSSCILEHPGMVCLLLKSLYGLKQAGEIWGSLLCTTLLSWGFLLSNIDKRAFFLQSGHEFVIIVVVVDDMQFISNSASMMSRIKSRLASTFDVKLFGQLKTFIGWEISHFPMGV